MDSNTDLVVGSVVDGRADPRVPVWPCSAQTLQLGSDRRDAVYTYRYNGLRRLTAYFGRLAQLDGTES